jgi:secreted trypsin-like serine protease
VLFLAAFLATANAQFCGRARVTGSLSIGSEYAFRGQWPWLVPLLKIDGDKFFCGSTIVSENFLLTGKIAALIEKKIIKISIFNYTINLNNRNFIIL